MSEPRSFDPGSVEGFAVTDWAFEPVSRTLALRYELRGSGPGQPYRFEETVTFVTEPAGPPGMWREGEPFTRAVDHLHVAAGVSYYKAAAPRTVVIEQAAMTDEELGFHRLLYDEGLREFAVANGLAVPLDVELRATHRRPIPIEGTIAEPAVGRLDSGPGRPDAGPAHNPWRRPVVLIGGGKDSMVLIEALRPLNPRLFAVNPHPLVRDLARATGLDLIEVRRELAPELFDLNRRGARNGHVPITAIVSLVAVVGSFLYDYDGIAMSIERSASEATATVGGVDVNHQFSKSLPFEEALRRLVATSIDPDLSYASALRPYSELAIGRAFAGLTQYHAGFCSCNRAFRRDARADDRWCGNCPKCRFVALVLAPFLDRRALAAMMGHDLFGDPGQVGGFRALFVDDDKPFECVGERRESAAAITLLADRPDYRDTPVVRALAVPARELVTEGDVAEQLAPAADLVVGDSRIDGLVAGLLATGAATGPEPAEPREPRGAP